MKSFLKYAWKDPVWSKVIATVIVAFGSVLITAIKSLISNVPFRTAFLNLLNYKISFWIVLLALFVIILSIALCKKYLKSPTPSFVEEFTSGNYQNQQWQWMWRWSDSDMFYYVDELNVMCPNCKTGILNLGYSHYRCGNCGMELEYGMLGIDSEGVRRQILLDVRNAYPQYKNLVGEFCPI